MASSPTMTDSKLTPEEYKRSFYPWKFILVCLINLAVVILFNHRLGVWLGTALAIPFMFAADIAVLEVGYQWERKWGKR